MKRWRLLSQKAQLSVIFTGLIFSALIITIIWGAEISFMTAYSNSKTPEPTSTSNSQAVAEAPLSIRNVSGQLIGDGTFSVFAPETITYPRTVRVELELKFDNKYITPTPAGQITSVPVTTSTPHPDRPTPTPRSPIYTESGQLIYQLMGASLICPAQSFDGCDAEILPVNARVINSNVYSWTWVLAPKEKIVGLQDLQLQAWILQEVGGNSQKITPVWDYTFSIEVNIPEKKVKSNLLENNFGAIVGAVATILAALIAVVLGSYFTQKQNPRKQKVKK